MEQKILGSMIEDKASPIIDNMLSSRKLPQGDDWNVMANFLAVMYTRGPTLRKLIKLLHQFCSEVIEDHIHSDERTWKVTIEQVSRETGIEVDMDYEQALHARESFEINVEIPRTHYVVQMLQVATILVAVFAEMTPNLEIVEVMSGAEYVISDCPIVPVPKSLNPSDGWRWYKNPNADLFFPLSSEACLILNYDKRRKVTTVNKKRAALINHLMACNSQRAIISKKQDFVWRRENGTTCSSHEELLEFLEHIPCGPAETDLPKESLRKDILKTLEEHPQSE